MMATKLTEKPRRAALPPSAPLVRPRPPRRRNWQTVVRASERSHALSCFGRRLRLDVAGSVLVEATVMITILFTFVLGGIDFLFAFYQYNAATKAVELGARIAAVWDPVATGLTGLSTAVLGSYNAGSAMPWFKVVCDGSTQSCSCTGTCTGVSGYSATAMNALVYGRGNSACGAGGSLYTEGMCNLYAGIAPANVKVTYACGSATTACSLGYVGRPDGPVPTITIQLQNVPFTYYFLGSLMNFLNVHMPPLTTTITGEYMSSAAP